MNHQEAKIAINKETLPLRINNVLGFAKVLPNEYGPPIWMIFITYYLLGGNRRNVNFLFSKEENVGKIYFS
jgi:hypothetical protein